MFLTTVDIARLPVGDYDDLHVSAQRTHDN